jgi:hypothetical protein
MIHQHVTEVEAQAIAAGEVKPGQGASWEQCPECLEQVEAYRKVYRMVIAQELPDLNMDLAAAVLSRLPQPARRRSLWDKFTPVVGPSAVTVLSLVAAYFLFWRKLAILFRGVTVPEISLVVMTASCIAAWIVYDLKSDYDRKLQRLASE